MRKQVRLARVLAGCVVAVAALALPAPATAQLVIGPGPGGPPEISLIEPGGVRTVQAYDPAFLGGVSVTLGDVNGDGTPDIITAAGPGGSPHVRVFSGTDLSELASFMAYDPTFGGGVRVAAGDVDGDGHADIITGAGAGGGPHVKVFSGADFSVLASFFAYAPAFGGGVFVAAGDVNGDGHADIVTGAGPGGGPHVRVFSGMDLSELASFMAYDPAFGGGVSVAAGDIDGDGLSDLITGAGPGGGPHVQILSGADLSVLASFWAYDPAFGGGVSVATGDLDGDGRVDLITGAGPGGGPHVRVFSGLNGAELASFFATTGGAGVSIGSLGDGAGLRFTGATAASFAAGSPRTFTVTTAGNPRPTLALTGTLPSGITFVDNGDGTATLSGTPAATNAGEHPLTFTATNPTRTVTRNFTLTITDAPAITSASTATMTFGAAGSFTVTTTGFPKPELTRGGVALPAGVTWVDHGDGTGTLSGTPATGTDGTYALTFTASNSAGSSAVQAFTLTVSGAPTFTSAAATTFTVGNAGTFTVTAVGTPTPAITAGALPAGVTFVDQGNGTGTLSGTPDAGTGGAHAITFTATNGIPPNRSQAFTLTVNQAPAVTSGASATFITGLAGSFAVTTTGFPAAALARGGVALPAGVTWVDNGNGTGTLGGIPGPGTSGTYALTFTPSNAAGTGAVQNFTLTVNQGASFTSAAATTFTVGVDSPFPLTTAGSPAVATIVRTGVALPNGVTYTDNHDGTATLGGAPAAGTGGVYNIVFTINNGVGGDVVQNFTLTVAEAPVFTSANATTFTVGSLGAFTVTTAAQPAVTTIVLGGVALPTGVNFTNNGNGTATLSGTPATGTGGTHVLTFTANNGIGGDVVQTFTLTIDEPPTITSGSTATFLLNTAATPFQVAMTGTPAPTVSVTAGTLPTGLTLSASGVLSGTPTQSGSFPVTLTATNGTLPNATQAFTVVVNAAPAITSAAATTFTVGSAGSFNVVMTGFPAPTVSVTAGTLPAGVTLTPAGLLSGTPDTGTGGTYNVTLTATNGVGANAVQAFALTINEPPIITSGNTATFLLNTPGTTFQVVMTGIPTPTVSVTAGVLPNGLTLSASGLLSGTPTQSGSFQVTLTATNGTLPNATQVFTVLVNAAPAITSANSTTFTVGTAATPFTVTTTGFPVPTVSESGALPSGVLFTPATRVLGGTPTQTGAFPLVFTATNGINPDATQNFTLNVLCPAITVNPATLPDGLFQTAYGPVTASQTGSTGTTFTWSATGPGLVAGLAIDANTGIVSGTPTNTVLNGLVTITVTDNFGCAGTRNTTLTVRPLADADPFIGGVGNTQFVVGAAPPLTPHVFVADNVLNGDLGPGPLSAALATPPANGGVSLAANGTFIYTPNVGFAGPSDSFTYTLTDGNLVTNTGTVTIALSQIVWYVNNSGANGDGRSHSPFNTLANAATPSAANSFIYVHTGGGAVTPTPGSIALDTIQTLQGAGGVFTVNGLTIPAGTRPTLSGTVTLNNSTAIRDLNFSAATPAITATSGAVFTLASTIDQVTVTGGSNALSLSNVTATGAGAINVSNASFTNTAGAEVLISQGDVPITFANTVTISSNAGRAIDIQNRSAGAVTFNGSISDTGGTGIILNANGTSSFTFSGGITLSGASSTFTATGNGTLNITGTNTIGAPTAATSTPLTITNTTIGGSGVTFRSIAANGSANGIVLNTTGAGAFQVTGVGTTAGTGGTIQNTTNRGASFISANNITLKNMNFTNTATLDLDADNSGLSTGDNLVTNAAIHLQTVTGVVLDRLAINGSAEQGINGNAVTTFSLTNSTITNAGNGADEDGLHFFNMLGTNTITSTSITSSGDDNVNIQNASGTSTITITGGSFNTGVLGSGLLFGPRGTTNTTINISGVTIDNNFSGGIVADASDTATMVIKVNTATITNNNDGIQVSDANGNVGFDIDNVSISGNDFLGITILKAAFSTTGTLQGFIRNSDITVGTDRTTDGVSIFAAGGGNLTVAVTNNTIDYAGTQRGILVQGGQDGNGAMNVTITGNTMDIKLDGTLDAVNGILAQTAITGPGNTTSLCADIGGTANTFTHSTGGVLAGGDIRMRQRNDGTIRLPGYAGGATDTAAVGAFLDGRNNEVSASTASAASTGFAGGGACTQPVVP